MMMKWKRIFCVILAVLLLVGIFSQNPVDAEAAVSCKSLCSAALKATGGAAHLKYKSDNAYDFGALPASAKKKVKSISYICDEKEVYSLCVIQAKNTAGAKSLQKQLNTYKKNNSKSSYLSDYSSDEQKVFKNAICGRQGKYVWYIAMSPDKAVNKKGQTAIKKAL